MCDGQLLAGEDRVELGAQRRVGVEAEDRVGLGQSASANSVAVPLGEAAHGDHGPVRRIRAGEELGVGEGEHRVDRVLLRRLDEAAGVDHDRVGVVRVLDQRPAVPLEPGGELLGVDLVTRAARA